MNNLPITPYLEEICNSLKKSPSRFLILTAQTAAGKSTAVPVALLKNFSGKILMLEPRRLAVLAIANRVSQLLKEPLGQTSGYRMHLDSCVSNQTRFEVITEAILTKKLQNDPTLEGISVVVLDEFHERSIHTDLALAFLKEAMELRDDLFVIIMSATIDTNPLEKFLSKDNKTTPILNIPGRQFPVKIEYKGHIKPSEAIQQELALTNTKSSILVFLPGIFDINQCKRELEENNCNAEILILHSSVPFSEQKKVLEECDSNNSRRVILSSAIAETSITVPNVTTVIDSGLSRINRLVVSAGMETLVTENESAFSAEQRAGRAGRTAPGKCIRLWNEFDSRIQQTQPEILRCDLTSLVLECICWGISNPQNLLWLTPPTQNAWNVAIELLEQMNCIQTTPYLSLTQTGKAVLQIGLSPRLARTALYSVETALDFSLYKKSDSNLKKKFILETERRIKNLTPEKKEFVKILENIPLRTQALLAGFPDRLAKKTQTEQIYKFPSGRIASLPKDKIVPLENEWLVAPEVNAGEKQGQIYSFEFIPKTQAEGWLLENKRISKKTITAFTDNHSLKKTEYTCYGKIILSEKKLSTASFTQDDYAQAVCNAVVEQGFDWLPIDNEINNFLLRARFYAQQKGESLISKAALSQNVKEWLIPFLGGQNKITPKIVYEALRWYLPSKEIDAKAVEFFTLPSGRKCKIKYEERQQKIEISSTEEKTQNYIHPVIEIIIQQIFGCFETPKVLNMPVLLKLLSPARRPLQITDDLAGFWQGAWPEICKEMKGRYPKHNWEYKIAESID